MKKRLHYGIISLKDKNKRFIPDTTFDEIVELYLFNRDFRQLLFTKIEMIEITLSSCFLTLLLFATVPAFLYLWTNTVTDTLEMAEWKDGKDLGP